MTSIASRINSPPRVREQYVRAENAISKFHQIANFCVQNCINQEFSLSTSEQYPVRGNVGCCIMTFPDDAAVLFIDEHKVLPKGRLELVGVPISKEEGTTYGHPCYYHGKAGCVLNNFKPPICLSFICEKYKAHLRKTYSIDYDISKFWNLLDGILMGMATDEEVKIFVFEIEEMIDAIHGRQ